MELLIAVVPVLLFVAILMWMDSFKLIKYTDLLITVFAGIGVSLIAYIIITYIVGSFDVSSRMLTVYIAPFIEELLKIGVISYIIFSHRSGFIIDSVIYGFAVGTGFALSENIFYYFNITESNFLLHIVRGFGTAVMHGCTVATAAVIMYYLLNVKNMNKYASFSIAFLPALVLHSFYNSFLLDPLLQMIIIILAFTITVTLLFNHNEQLIRRWIEDEFDTEMELLLMLKSGKFSESKTGQYIMEIKSRFTDFIIVDMICLLQLNLELSMKFKADLMLKDSGLDVPEDPELKAKIEEYRHLQHNIGKTGITALKPVLPMSSKDIWKLNLMKQN